MSVKLGINGFGRIGRYLTRLLIDKDIIAVINARADNAQLAHLFKYDSIHGRFQGTVSNDEKGLIINDHHIPVTRCKLGEWNWSDYGVDIVAETTGALKERSGLAAHLDRGAKKVIVSAPVKDADTTLVYGVNNAMYDPAKDKVISAASCTTNCLAPVIKVLHNAFGIEHGTMTTIHSYTMSQRILDGSQKDIRRARAAAMSMIPTTTGAAKAVGLVIPELAGRLDGTAMRVPTPDGSVVDLVCVMKTPVVAEQVNAAMLAASEDELAGVLGYSEEPLVSVDYIGDTHGGVVDSLSTHVINDTLLKMLIWYDNEAGFTNQLARLILFIAQSL